MFLGLKTFNIDRACPKPTSPALSQPDGFEVFHIKLEIASPFDPPQALRFIVELAEQKGPRLMEKRYRTLLAFINKMLG